MVHSEEMLEDCSYIIHYGEKKYEEFLIWGKPDLNYLKELSQILQMVGQLM